MDAAGTADLPLATDRAPARPAAFSLRLQLALALALFLTCLAPAAINGVPLVFTDTEGYLQAAQIFRPIFDRAFGYGAFLRVTGGLWSLWLPALAQAGLAAWLVPRAIALEAPRWPDRWRRPAALGLVAILLLGHLPWLAAWIQPDIFTGLMILALWLLAEHWHAMPRTKRALMLLAALGAATTHLTNPPLLAGIGLFALGTALLRSFRHRRHRRAGEAGPPAGLAPIRRTVLLALPLAALGWGLLVSANYITYRQATFSPSSPVFLFARLAADGDPAAALRPGCQAGAPWVACRYLDRLKLPADEFLWRAWSPLPEMGGIPGFMREAAELNPILLRQDWPIWLVNSAVRMVNQMTALGLGDGMDAEGPWMLGQYLGRHGLEHLAVAIRASRQATDGMQGLMPHLPAEILAGAGLLGLAGLFLYGLGQHRTSIWWPALFMLAIWAGNAALIALGGEVHARYSARLVWIAPLLAGLVALRAAAPRPPRRGSLA
ncbi:MAG: hypothetical protein QJR07_21465 [Acetobacteraceae bacterium]|nr:hypothetical protein [Acetobacteraceae bacterium]MDI3309648.1 hypothetical protein [Acetobacteraceae bacterium]